MNTCNKCKGEGLIGVGENPHLKEGPISTCDTCSGTGKADENAIAPSTPEPEQIPEDDSSKKNDGGEESSVDEENHDEEESEDASNDLSDA